MFYRPSSASCCHHVIKELVHPFTVYCSCANIELWMHLESLESTQEAAPRATLTLLSCSPNFPRTSITRYTHAKHEPILKMTMTLIPLELQPTPNTSRRKAREAYLIHRGQMQEPSGEWTAKMNVHCLPLLVSLLYTFIYICISLFRKQSFENMRAD